MELSSECHKELYHPTHFDVSIDSKNQSLINIVDIVSEAMVDDKALLVVPFVEFGYTGRFS